jgi:RNA polymerase sigma-70 factor, ECF subfamily
LSRPPLISESDEQLLHALGRGEPEAVATLYQRHGARMVAFARRYVPDRSVAEDVVIGLLGRWLERPPRVRDAERLATFLATSVYHASVDWIRRERAERGEQPRVETRGERAPAARMATGELRSRLQLALERLSSDDRLLLETHYGHALTTEECMELLGISRAAFHQRLHRARVRVAELIGPPGEKA